ncbi:HEPN domain-containing protein [Nostoc sp. MS1]|uniref:HEPN domain-containing protein n=1 Tax=Nostoc sp. MS1 TaxID=2764711 RepID=UPI001CC5A49D|nr:HEPN domain-containing protein [Nostoc sp. MS1]BCL34510.1 hypothetical protein NSMS1_09570 [Nostoc sp. MS1]
MQSQLIEIKITNIGPSFVNTDDRTIREFWEEVVNVLSTSGVTVIPYKKEQKSYSIEIDASDVIAYLKAVEICEHDQEVFYQRMNEQMKLGYHMLNSILKLQLKYDQFSETEENVLQIVIGKFIQQLFLAMNIALPGSIALYSAEYIETNAFESKSSSLLYKIPGIKSAVPKPPEMNASILESAFIHALDRGWPPLQQMPFKTVWNWLEGELPYSLDLAEKPHHKALFTILRITSKQTNILDTILLIAQALEALFVDGKEGIGSTLKQRLELVLGTPQSHKNWFSKFYNRRSQIAHGSAAILRPNDLYHWDDPSIEEYIEEFYGPIDEAVAVLLAVLQDLIRSDAREYCFLQEVKRLNRHNQQEE